MKWNAVGWISNEVIIYQSQSKNATTETHTTLFSERMKLIFFSHTLLSDELFSKRRQMANKKKSNKKHERKEQQLNAILENVHRIQVVQLNRKIHTHTHTYNVAPPYCSFIY